MPHKNTNTTPAPRFYRPGVSATKPAIPSYRPFLIALLACFCLAMPLGRADYGGEELITSAAEFHAGKETAKLLAKARHAEAEGALQKAALLYQDTIEAALRESGAMAARDRDEISRTERFVPVTDFCFERLVGLGEDIREKYLVSYEYKAEKLFDKALANSNLTLMLDLAQRYPLCESGLKARTFVADIAAESGVYALAARHYGLALRTRLAYSCKTAESRSAIAALAAKNASVLAAMGRGDEIGVIAAIVNAKGLKDEKVSIRTKTLALSQVLDEALEAAQNVPATRTDATATDHAILGGNAARDMLMPGPSGLPGETVWTDYLANDDRMFSIFDSGVRISQFSHMVSGVPVCWQDTVYVNTGRALLAYDAFDGSRVFKFNPPQRPRYLSSQYPPTIETCSVADGIVYAARPTEGNVLSLVIKHLYALDARTGKVLWNSHEQTGLERGVESVCGDVVVRDGEALFVVSKNMAGDMPLSLVCADAKTGRLKWRCEMVNKIGFAPRAYEPLISDIITIQDDTAIVATSGGAVVAVDLFSRSIKWGVRYHQHYSPRLRRGDRGNPRVWCATRPILHDGKFVYAPRDSKTLLCLDAETGHTLWSILREDKVRGEILYIVGVRDGLLYYIDDRYRHEPAFNRPAQRRDPKSVQPPRLRAVDIDTGKEVMNCDLQDTDGTDENKVNLVPMGRPAITESAIYIPTTQALVMYDFATKELHKVFNWHDRNLKPGNLLATQLGLVVANAVHVSLLADPQALLNLCARTGPASGAPDIFRRGKLRCAYGDPVEGLADFEKAAEIAIPSDRYRGAPLRPLITEQIFRCRMCLAGQSEKTGNMAEAMRHMRLAIELDVSDEIRAGAEANLANLEINSDDEKIRNHGLDTLQRLILEHPQRTVSVDENIRQSVAHYATIRLRRLLARIGRAPYAAHEKRAEELLAQAQRSDRRSDYIAVYRKYPNSLAALRAMSEVAAQHEKNGNKSMALASLKAACENVGNPRHAIGALIEMERLAVECADFEAARATLARLGEDGIDLADFAAKELARIETLDCDGAGTLGAQMKTVRTIDLDAITGSARSHKNFDMITPEGPRPAALADRVLARKNGVFVCYDLADGKLLWTNGPDRAWLGFTIYPAHKPPRVKMDSGGKISGIGRLDIILKIDGVEIKDNSDYWRAIVKLKIGDKVTVDYSENATGIVKQTVITASKMPGDFSIAPSKIWFNGEGNLVVQVRHVSTEVRCIDIDTGATLWFRSLHTSPAYSDKITREVSGGMIIFTVRSGSQFEFQALDMISGAITTLPSRSEPSAHKEAAPLGSNLLLAQNYRNSCEVIDILTGAVKFEIAIPANEAINYRLGGDRLLVVEGKSHNACVLDIVEGRVLYRTDSGQAWRTHSQEADREIAVLDGRGDTVMFFDTRGTRPRRSVNTRFASTHIIVKGELLCCIAQDRNTIETYDIATGKPLWTRKNLKAISVNNLNFCGDYLVLSHAERRRVNSGKPNSAYITDIKLLVLDAGTGAEVFSHKKTQQGNVSALKARIVGQRLCIVAGTTIQVLE